MKTIFLKSYMTILMIVMVLISFGQPRGERTRESRNTEVRNQSSNVQRREIPQQRQRPDINKNQDRQSQREVNRQPQRQREVERQRTQNFPKGEINRNRPNNNDRYDRGRDFNGDRFNYSKYYRKGHVPYYFKNSPYYLYSASHGHIMRNFSHRPIIIYSHRNPFYIDNGFIYRYYSGLGYVWIEDPYDMWFDELPYDAIRMIINGQLYFRVGNAFFQFVPRFGFHLVMLPDRYYIY